jgi:hypothetical protein
VPTCRKLIKKLLEFSVKFYLHFCFGPHVFVGKSSLLISGVVPGRGSVRNMLLHTHTHTHTHTHHTSANFTKNVSLPTNRSSHATFWQRHRQRPRQTKLFRVLFVSADLRHQFQYIIHEDESNISTRNFLTHAQERINRPGPL